MPIVLPDLGLVAAVIALLIIAGALWVADRLVSYIAPNVPVIGSWLKRTISGWLNDARNSVLKAAGSTLDGAVHLFNWAGDVFERPFNAIVSTFADVTSWIERTVTVTIPRIYDRITADVSAAEARVTVRMDDLFNRAERDTAAAKAAAIVTAEAYAHNIYTDIDTWGKTAVHDAWPDSGQDIAALRKTLGGDFPWLNDLAGALGGLGAAGLLGALIRSMATSQAVVRLADECVVPNCRNLSQFGRDLQGLIGEAPQAAMLAWMTFLVADPSGWAKDTADIGGPVARGVTDATARLFGRPAP